MKKVIGASVLALMMGYLVGLKYPVRFGVVIKPQPWTATEFYETKIPPGWYISEELNAGQYGKWKSYRADFYDAPDTIMLAVKARSTMIEEVYTWNHLGEVEVKIKGEAEWRDVDSLIYQGLEKITSSRPKEYASTDPLFEKAVAAWSKALGKPIPIPSIHHGACHVLKLFVIACADHTRNQITVENPRFEDMYSVYLHEMGHILGVSHIEGDPLMEADYNKPSGITPAALAAARHPHFDDK